jgi:hypothetical protein
MRAVRHEDLSHEPTGEELRVVAAQRVHVKIKAPGGEMQLDAPSSGAVSYSVALMIVGATVVGTLYGLGKVSASVGLVGPWAATVMVGVPGVVAATIVSVLWIWHRRAGPPPSPASGRSPGRYTARHR